MKHAARLARINRAADALLAREDDDDIVVWVQYKKPFVHLAVEDGEEEIRSRVERDGPAGEFAQTGQFDHFAQDWPGAVPTVTWLTPSAFAAVSCAVRTAAPARRGADQANRGRASIVRRLRRAAR